MYVTQAIYANTTYANLLMAGLDKKLFEKTFFKPLLWL